MAEGQLAESGGHGGVDSAGVIEEDTDDFADEEGVFAGDRSGSVGAGELHLLAVDDGGEGTGTVGGLASTSDAKAFEGGVDVAGHAETNDAGGFVVVDGHADVLGALGVHLEAILFADGGEEVVDCGLSGVLDGEVVNDEGEVDTVGGVVEEAGGMRGRVVSMGG